MSVSPHSKEPALRVADLTHRFKDRVAVDAVSFEIPQGEIFGLLGPNGGGKTTLFRVLSTLFAPQEGSVTVLGVDLASDPRSVRGRLGVVFQSPSLDGKLRVEENLMHQGHLYGLHGTALRTRIVTMLDQFKIADRARDNAGELSGGLQRRVEIAKSLLHGPGILLLDEPSSGLDPGARADLWVLLHRLRSAEGMTIVLTTHLMEEAERCDRVGIMDSGRLVALDTPAALRAEVGGEVLTLAVADPDDFLNSPLLPAGARMLDGQIRVETTQAARLLGDLQSALPGRIRTATVGQPTLEDVFIRKTGHRMHGGPES